MAAVRKKYADSSHLSLSLSFTKNDAIAQASAKITASIFILPPLLMLYAPFQVLLRIR
jgi:hypothetical protein